MEDQFQLEEHSEDIRRGIMGDRRTQSGIYMDESQWPTIGLQARFMVLQ